MFLLNPMWSVRQRWRLCVRAPAGVWTTPPRTPRTAFFHTRSPSTPNLCRRGRSALTFVVGTVVTRLRRCQSPCRAHSRSRTNQRTMRCMVYFVPLIAQRSLFWSVALTTSNRFCSSSTRCALRCLAFRETPFFPQRRPRLDIF